MRTVWTLGLAAASALALAGCAGLPAAVTVASLYVDSVLLMRTGKGSTEHIVSAAAGQDCGILNLFERGSFCTDAPPPQLLVALTREVRNVPLDGPPETPPTPVRVASLPGGPISDGVPAPGAQAEPGIPVRLVPPATKPGSAAAAAAAVPPAPQAAAVQVATAPEPRRTTSLVVVVGSFRERALAETHRTRLGRPDAEIAEATVFGARHYRVVLRPADRDGALRELRVARAGGVPDAWLLSDPRGHQPGNPIAVLAAGLMGALL